MSVLAIACAKEQVAPLDGEICEATFDVAVPETSVMTKGLSDAAQVNELVCQVFLNDEQLTPVPELNKTVEIQNLKAKVTFTLVKGNKYLFAFWAQTKGTGYYDTADLRAVKMNTDKVKANDSKMDAFFKQQTLTATASVKPKNVTLLRALAQVNFGTVIPERSDALTLVKSKLNFTNLPNTFNVALGDKDNAYSGSENVEFQENDVISDEKLIAAGTEYSYVATAYVFAPKNKIITDASATVTLSKGNPTTVKAPNAPIQRNYRTNIVGDLLTVDSEWNITVDPQLGKDYMYDSVSANLEKGANVTLAEDYSASSKNGVVIPMHVISSLDLNGYTFKNTVGTALEVRGILTINGQGNVVCGGGNGANAAVFVQDGGKVIINEGYYYAKKDANGNGNSCIYVQAGNPTGNTINVNGENKPLYYGGGVVEINGGVFESDGNQYVLNQHDYIENDCCFIVKGGIFVGFNPADVNECHGKVTSFVAEGYKSVATTYDGKQAWEVKPIEPVGTQENFKTAAAEENATVVLSSGTYNIPDGIADGVTILGSEGTVIDIPAQINCGGKHLTFKNVTMTSPNKDYTGIIHVASVKYVGCTIEGQPFSYADNAVFEKCTFNQTSSGSYNIWTYGSKNITFNNCVFNCAGKSVLIYNEGALSAGIVTFDKCKFVASESVAGKAAIEIDSRFTSYEVYINGCTHDGFANGSVSGNSLWNKKAGDKSVKVFVDGTQVL